MHKPRLDIHNLIRIGEVTRKPHIGTGGHARAEPQIARFQSRRLGALSRKPEFFTLIDNKDCWVVIPHEIPVLIENAISRNPHYTKGQHETH
jgi:hypothetical protein